jgi:hypothetical protein
MKLTHNQADWTTQYTIEGARDHGWRECQVLGVSPEGIHLHLNDTTPDQLSAHRIIVALNLARASLRLRGEVRHLELVEEGGVRVGLEFAALSVFERDMLDAFLKTSPHANTTT